MSNADSRIPELDGLRGLAIGLVLMAHFCQFVTRPGSFLAYAVVPLRLSWSGVDLFFVLSGFLIGGILLDARESTNYFRVFYTRRFLRIIPIYAVFLLAVSFTVYLSQTGIIPKYEEIFSGRWHLLSFALFLQNFEMTIRHSWILFPFGVTWSLAVEEQFYLTLPLLVRLLSRRALLVVVSVGIFIAPLLRTLFHAFSPDNFYAWYTLMPCRADALLLGVLGAIAVREPLTRNFLLRHGRLLRFVLFVLLSGAAFLGWAAPTYLHPLMITAGLTWLALLYLAFLLYAVLFPSSFLSRCLRWSWLRSLGIIAYATYLFHQFFLGLFFGRIPFILSFRDAILSLLALVFTLFFCRLSWVYFEKPLVKLGHRSTYQFGESPRSSQTAASAVGASFP